MILFICTGNTCRSPMAAAFAEKMGLPAQSAGLSPYPGAPATKEACLAAQRRGCDLSGHRARAVTPDMLHEAEKIYAMTESHARILRMLSPENAGKIFVLSPPVPDPFGGSDADYEICAQKIQQGLREIILSERRYL